MRYASARGSGGSVTLAEAIAAGLAPDGGLFVPERLPRLAPADFEDAGDLAAVAARLLAPFAVEDPGVGELPGMAAEAFAFDAPVRPLAGPGTSVLELFHGPTAAFKDFGARFLAAWLRRHLPPGERLTVLVATSGDTGSAVGAAFDGAPGVRVGILYPEGRVSPRQAHLLGCYGDNVRTFAVRGSFDDCQRMVKQAFADAELREREALTSANSISLGRLLPQMAYYARAALDHWRARGEPMRFIVPTGNLGNAFACLLARAIGLPIGDVLLATNANRVIPDYLDSGVYAPRPSVPTLANAMDVGDPGNLERLRWLHPRPSHAGIRAESVDDETIRARIAEGESRYGAIWCPHTACAVEALERRRRAGDKGPWCVVATAHPAKFEGIVEPLVGHAVPPPPELAGLLGRSSRAEPLGAFYGELRRRLGER